MCMLTGSINLHQKYIHRLMWTRAVLPCFEYMVFTQIAVVFLKYQPGFYEKGVMSLFQRCE